MRWTRLGAGVFFVPGLSFRWASAAAWGFATCPCGIEALRRRWTSLGVGGLCFRPGLNFRWASAAAWVFATGPCGTEALDQFLGLCVCLAWAQFPRGLGGGVGRRHATPCGTEALKEA